jgi:N6-adenosine-specific RNA methylase IME4
MGSSMSLGVGRMLEFHPLANLFPLLEGEAFADLVEDIKAQGLHEPIVLYEDKALDGRNRYRACLAAGVALRFETYVGTDPLGYVVSLNLKRRHLSESQRAAVAAKLATLGHGQRQTGKFAALPTQAEAAALLKVSERSVRNAVQVRDHGAPELQRALDHGDVAVSTAADLTTLPIEEQREIVARGESEILRIAKDIRARKAAERHGESIKRIAEISLGTRALPTGQTYPVIYADPPWYFQVYDSVTGTARNPEAHYPCLHTEEICSMPVAELATKDAALFLWTTAPHLQESFRVIEAWGFKYVTNIAWVKSKKGLGFWVRNQHELLLIGSRRDMPAPAPARRPPSVIHAATREHSRKPDETYSLIERMFPELPKIELFARRPRKGWAAWGNQLSEAAE